MAINKSLEEIVSLVESEGYSFDKSPNKLNVVGIRDAKDTTALTFDDQLAAIYWDENGNLNGVTGPGTTSPSVYWLENPMVSQGTAILKGGQYNSYSIGSHRGKYSALVQTSPVTVIRDNDRNEYLNFFAPTYSGMYGINIHKASTGKDDVTYIDRDSAGCQVWQNESDFAEMMRLANISKSKYGNNFTYTLIDNRDIIRRRAGYGILALLVVGAFLIGRNYFVKK